MENSHSVYSDLSCARFLSSYSLILYTHSQVPKEKKQAKPSKVCPMMVPLPFQKHEHQHVDNYRGFMRRWDFSPTLRTPLPPV